MKKYLLAKNTLFTLLFLLGLGYLFGFFVISDRILRSNLMYFITLADSLKNHLPFNLSFISVLFNFLSLLAVLYLSCRLIRAVFCFFLEVFHTRRFLQKHSSLSSGSYTVLPSSRLEAFTLGFLYPQVFVSTPTIDTFSSDELASILYHEELHRQELDPLKKILLKLVNSVLPPFFGSGWLFGHFDTLSEISADLYAASRLGTNKPLISALVAIQSAAVPEYAVASHFSAQHERFAALVGRSRPNLFALFTGLGGLVVILFFALTTLSTTSAFYDCRHLSRCWQTLFTSQTTHTQVMDRLSSTPCL
ncbi:M48 family metalloprotease [Patescibacteria group bacterium]|nr:M48 family metalloprotease [Patescibacteria group bacterium]